MITLRNGPVGARRAARRRARRSRAGGSARRTGSGATCCARPGRRRWASRRSARASRWSRGPTGSATACCRSAAAPGSCSATARTAPRSTAPSRYSAWSVTERTASRVVLELDTTGLVGVNFPWRFRAQITYALSGDRLTVGTSVRNVDRRAVPGRLRAPPVPAAHAVAASARRPRRPRASRVLEVPAAARATRWSTRSPSGPAGDVPARADFRVARPLDLVVRRRRAHRVGARRARADHATRTSA